MNSSYDIVDFVKHNYYKSFVCELNTTVDLEFVGDVFIYPGLVEVKQSKHLTRETQS